MRSHAVCIGANSGRNFADVKTSIARSRSIQSVQHVVSDAAQLPFAFVESWGGKHVISQLF
jgi:hypothetical protein